MSHLKLKKNKVFISCFFNKIVLKGVVILDQIIKELLNCSQAFKSFKDLTFLVDQLKSKKMIVFTSPTNGSSNVLKLYLDITKKLIENDNFHFLALDGAWSTFSELSRILLKGKKTELDSFFYEQSEKFYSVYFSRDLIDFYFWLFDFNLKSKRKIQIYGLNLDLVDDSFKFLENEIEKIKFPQLTRDFYEKRFDLVFKHLLSLYHLDFKSINIIQNAYLLFQNARLKKEIEFNSTKASKIRSQYFINTIESLSELYPTSSQFILWLPFENLVSLQSEFKSGVDLLRDTFGSNNLFVLLATGLEGEIFNFDLNEIVELEPAKLGSLESSLFKVSEIMKADSIFSVFGDSSQLSSLKDLRPLRRDLDTHRGESDGQFYLNIQPSYFFNGVVFFRKLTPIQRFFLKQRSSYQFLEKGI